MMKNRVRCLLVLVAALSMSGAHSHAQAPQQLPTQIPQVKWDSGQNVVPVFEGWIKNPDDSFDLVFGYFNRNYKEEIAIPAGSENMLDPGAPDRGQPTYFLPRRQARLFRVRVPKDWGRKVLTWTITVNGRAEKAFGSLLPVEEINEEIMTSGGNAVPFGEPNPNKPPTLAVAPVPAATVLAPLALTATVTDDGLPKPRALTRATTTTADGTLQRQTNSNAPTRPQGLTVRWLEYAGPAKVTFEPAGPIPVANGTAKVTASFAAPGTYKLVATASDGALSTRSDVVVTVK